MKIDPLKAAAWVTTIGAAIVMLNIGYDHFQKRDAALKTELEIRGVILEKDLNDDAARVAYYKNKKQTVELDAADQGRFEYLQEQLAQKQIDRRDLQMRQNALKDK